MFGRWAGVINNSPNKVLFVQMDLLPWSWLPFCHRYFLPSMRPSYRMACECRWLFNTLNRHFSLQTLMSFKYWLKTHKNSYFDSFFFFNSKSQARRQYSASLPFSRFNFYRHIRPTEALIRSDWIIQRAWRLLRAAPLTTAWLSLSEISGVKLGRFQKPKFSFKAENLRRFEGKYTDFIYLKALLVGRSI